MKNAVDLATIVLVALGAGTVGVRATWRGVAVGLSLLYAGVVVHLLLTSSLIAALSTAVVAAGVLAVVLVDDHGRISLRERASARPGPRGANPSAARSQLARILAALAPSFGKGPGGDIRRPWFDLSVIGLAIVGAVALAFSHPLLGSVASDAIVNILLLTGVLYALLGQPVRAGGGLLLLMSAGTVLLRAADPTVSAGETLLFAVAQLALTLVLVQWKAPTTGTEPPT